MAEGDIKDLIRRTASDKLFPDKVFNIAKNQNNDGYLLGIASMVYKFFNKKTCGEAIKNDIISNRELTEELHKLIIRTIWEKKVYLPFIGDIWRTDM